MKARELRRILESLGYRTVRQSGSHRHLECPGRRSVTFGFHDRQSLPPGLVRKVLMKEAGLTDEEIQAILSGRKPDTAARPTAEGEVTGDDHSDD